MIPANVSRRQNIAALNGRKAQLSYQDLILSDSPQIYWRLDEAAGNFVPVVGTEDLAPNGVLTYSVPGAISDGDTAVNLNGGYLDTADHAVFDLGDGPFSIECWVNPASYAALRAVIGKGTDAYLIFLDGTGQVFLSKRFVADIARSSVSAPIGSWTHIVVTKNGAATVIYVDGVDVTVAIANHVLLDNISRFAVGSEIGGAAVSTFRGDVDEVAIYNYVLTPAQVASHFNAA